MCSIAKNKRKWVLGPGLYLIPFPSRYGGKKKFRLTDGKMENSPNPPIFVIILKKEEEDRSRS